jgi:hypothetical protein
MSCFSYFQKGIKNLALHAQSCSIHGTSTEGEGSVQLTSALR